MQPKRPRNRPIFGIKKGMRYPVYSHIFPSREVAERELGIKLGFNRDSKWEGHFIQVRRLEGGRIGIAFLVHGFGIKTGIYGLDHIFKTGKIVPLGEYFNTTLREDHDPVQFARKTRPKNQADKIFRGDRICLDIMHSTAPKPSISSDRLFVWREGIPAEDIKAVHVVYPKGTTSEQLRAKKEAYTKRYRTDIIFIFEEGK